MKKRRLIIGILGAIGSGKTMISRMFKRLGADVINADNIAHDVIRMPDIKKRIREVWGDSVFSNDGQLKRDILAKVVFSGRKDVERLNRLMHPRILKVMKQVLRKSRAPLTIIDAALLLESSHEKMCDYLIYVNAPFDLRLKRLEESCGWHRNELMRRERYQISCVEKRRVSDFIIDNNGSKARTLKQVKQIFDGIFYGRKRTKS